MKKLLVELSAKKIEKDDAELLWSCRRGDEAAWNTLVDRYQRLIFTVGRRVGLSEEQAADVLQEGFLTLFEKLDEIEQPEKIRSWIVTTAKFKTWGAIRREKGIYSLKTEKRWNWKWQIYLIPRRSPMRF